MSAMHTKVRAKRNLKGCLGRYEKASYCKDRPYLAFVIPGHPYPGNTYTNAEKAFLHSENTSLISEKVFLHS